MSWMSQPTGAVPDVHKGSTSKMGKAAKPGKGGKGGGKAVDNALLDPTQTLSGQPLLNAATQIANAQTTGPITELARQRAEVNRQGAATQKQTFGYYMTLAKQAQESLAQEKANSAQLNQSLQGIGDNTQQQLQGFGQQAQGGALGRMSALGLAGSAPADLAAETARQQGIGALNSGAFRSAGAAQGANYNANAISNLGTFNLRGQERLGDIARATRLANVPLNSKIAALQASRGALKATAIGQLRSAERNYQIAQQGLGLKNKSLDITAQNNAANQSLRALGISAANNRSAATIAHEDQRAAAALAARTGISIGDAFAKIIAARTKASNGGRGGGGGGALSAAGNAAALGKLNKAIGVIQQAQATHQYSEAQIRALTASKYGIPDYMVQAAYELLGYGRLSPRTASALHAAGVRGGTFRGKPIVVSQGQGKQGVLGGSLFGVRV